MDLLERLVNTPGVPGREKRVRAVIEEYLRKAAIFDELRVDALGSLIGIRRARPRQGQRTEVRKLRVLLAAHMDQIGFLVSHVTAEGMLHLMPVGWFDVRTLMMRRVKVCTESGEDLSGLLVAPGRPMQIAGPHDMDKIPEFTGLYVDLALPADEVLRKVRPGDMVVLTGDFAKVGNSIVGPALDNRIGCWTLIRALESLVHHDCDICAVWTTQEELGSRGAGPVAEGYEADIGISCDTIVSCQGPGVAPHEYISRPGEGVSIVIADGSMLSDMSLVVMLEETAVRHDLKSQRSLIVGGGQDGAMIQRSRQGVRTAVLSCPIKHMHTAMEMVDNEDLQAFPKLLAAFLSTTDATMLVEMAE